MPLEPVPDWTLLDRCLVVIPKMKTKRASYIVVRRIVASNSTINKIKGALHNARLVWVARDRCLSLKRSLIPCSLRQHVCKGNHAMAFATNIYGDGTARVRQQLIGREGQGTRTRFLGLHELHNSTVQYSMVCSRPRVRDQHVVRDGNEIPSGIPVFWVPVGLAGGVKWPRELA